MRSQICWEIPIIMKMVPSLPVLMFLCCLSLSAQQITGTMNHTNFRLPDSDISSPTFNHILAAQPPRLVQFALKFMY